MLKHKFLLLFKLNNIVFLGSIILMLAFFTYYVSKVKISKPVFLSIENTKTTENSDFIVTAKPILRNDIVINPDTNSNYNIGFGYFSNVSIHFKQKEHFPVVNVTHAITNEILDYTYIIDEGNYVITDVDNYTFIKTATYVIYVNRYFFAVFLLFVFLFTAFLKWKNILQLNNIILTAVLSLAYFLLFLGAYFTYPNAEDLSLVIDSINYGVVKATFYSLVTHDARYTANFFYGLSFLASLGVEFHRLTPALLILLTLFSVFFFFQTFSKHFLCYKKLWPAVLFFVLFHFALIHAIVFELYWMASSFVYLLSWVFIIIWFSLFLRWINATTAMRKAIYAVLCLITLFLSYGLNEMNIIVNFFLVLCLAYYVLKYRNTCKHELIQIIVLSVITVTAILLLPGVSSRIEGVQESEAYQHSDATLMYGVLFFIKTLVKWTFANVIILPIMFLCTLYLYHYKENITVKLNKTELILLILGLIVTMLFCCLFFFKFSGFNLSYNKRMLNYIYWPFQFIVFVLIPVLLLKLNIKKLNALTALKHIIGFAVLVLFVTVLVFQKNNLKDIYNDYNTGRYTYLKQQLQTRYNKIKENKDIEGWNVLVVDELKSMPPTVFRGPDLFYNDPDQYYWRKAYKGFFRLDEIRLKNTTSKRKILLKYAE